MIDFFDSQNFGRAVWHSVSLEADAVPDELMDVLGKEMECLDRAADAAGAVILLGWRVEARLLLMY